MRKTLPFATTIGFGLQGIGTDSASIDFPTLPGYRMVLKGMMVSLQPVTTLNGQVEFTLIGAANNLVTDMEAAGLSWVMMPSTTETPLVKLDFGDGLENVVVGRQQIPFTLSVGGEYDDDNSMTCSVAIWGQLVPTV